MCSIRVTQSRRCASCSNPFYSNGTDCVPCPNCPMGKMPQNCGGNSSGTCVDVPCPVNSNGPNVAGGCTCNLGFNGTIIATTNGPNYYSGVCSNCGAANNNCSAY